ncbi:hypothetical protein RYX56_11580 [Alkalihalophilus lindianensis]|uniref:AhpC/TSA family protein n=1 Tax=Alkalihalophilus lindianensis TaxID=1630542 RepID=A0ABU3XAU6_9BACI|nr:hypothetical protein [Alkalihalophilus lindianensis]MDV2685011.1 hypothetical protein [Alkalihalophilus lindianensis]
MKKWLHHRTYLVILSAVFILIALSACGTNEPGGANDGLTLVNEDNQEIQLTNKDRATILFHFTEVG